MNFYLIDYENVNDAGLNGITSLTADDSVTIFYSEHADKMSFGLHRRLNESKATIEYRKIITGTKNALDFQLSSFLGYLIAKHPDSSFYIVSKDTGYTALKNIWQKSRIYCISEIAGRRDIERSETSTEHIEPQRVQDSKKPKGAPKIKESQKSKQPVKSKQAPKAKESARAEEPPKIKEPPKSKEPAEGFLQRYTKKRAVKDPKKKNDDIKKQIKKLFKDKNEAAEVYEIIKNSPTRQVVNNELTKKYGFDSGNVYKKIKEFVRDMPGQ